jgi:hypothetical protein
MGIKIQNGEVTRGLLASTTDGGLGSLGSNLSFVLIKVVSSSFLTLLHFFLKFKTHTAHSPSPASSSVVQTRDDLLEME